MSVEAMTLALHHSRAKGTDKVVLLGLANHCNDDGEMWPKVATLAKYANVTERAVQLSLQRLLDAGDIALPEDNKQDGGTHKTRGGYRTNKYVFTIVCPDDCMGGTSHKQRPVDNPPPEPSPGVKPTSPLAGSRGEAHFTAGVKPAAPLQEPSVEPSSSGGASVSTSPGGAVDNFPPSRPLARPERCADHQLEAIPPSCGRCKDARLTLEMVMADLEANPMPRCAHGVPGGCRYDPGGDLAYLEELA